MTDSDMTSSHGPPSRHISLIFSENLLLSRVTLRLPVTCLGDLTPVQHGELHSITQSRPLLCNTGATGV